MLLASITINSFNDFLDQIDRIIDVPPVKVDDDPNKALISLYRGQSGNHPLLPSIVRGFISNTKDIERVMLKELKRRRPDLKAKYVLEDDWDWLVLAQHFGLRTRLLDWTSNPLVALWFAVSAVEKDNYLTSNSYVVVFNSAQQFLLDKNEDSDKSPFSILTTRVLKPAMNNERIVAQSGWFTAHKYSFNSKTFVSIEEHVDLKDKITIFEVPASIKLELLQKLNRMGINSQSLFPDIVGICKQINWEYTSKKTH